METYHNNRRYSTDRANFILAWDDPQNDTPKGELFVKRTMEYFIQADGKSRPITKEAAIALIKKYKPNLLQCRDCTLSEARLARAIPQTDIARELGITQPGYIAYELGRVSPNRVAGGILYKLSRIFRVSMDTIYEMMLKTIENNAQAAQEEVAE